MEYFMFIHGMCEKTKLSLTEINNMTPWELEVHCALYIRDKEKSKS